MWEECRLAAGRTKVQECFKGAGLLELFSPTEHPHYDLLVPAWLKLWALVDHSPEWDVLWLSLLCRARKHSGKRDSGELDGSGEGGGGGGGSSSSSSSCCSWAAAAEPMVLMCAGRAIGVEVGTGSVPGSRRAPAS